MYTVKKLTYTVASENGTWKFSVLFNAFIPPRLKPTKNPAQVMLLANKSKCSFNMPLVTIDTEVERRYKIK